MTWKINKDKYGNVINPGDICIHNLRGSGCEYVVFVGSVWGGKTSLGKYGRFLNGNGFTSIKYSNVLLAFDPISDRRATVGINELVRRFYEQGK